MAEVCKMRRINTGSIQGFATLEFIPGTNIRISCTCRVMIPVLNSVMDISKRCGWSARYAVVVMRATEKRCRGGICRLELLINEGCKGLIPSSGFPVCIYRHVREQ